MYEEEFHLLDHELQCMCRLWRAFLARLFVDLNDRRKRIRKGADEFWEDREHVAFICDLALTPVAQLEDCVAVIRKLPPNERSAYAGHVRRALTEGFRLPTPERLRAEKKRAASAALSVSHTAR